MSEVGDTFQCAACGGVFEKGRDDDEAEAELRERFGESFDRSQCSIVCEDCAQRLYAVVGEDPAGKRRSFAEGLDALLEGYARNANQYANESGDRRWNDLALVLLGARTFTRPLMRAEG